MAGSSPDALQAFSWEPQPAAAAIVRQCLNQLSDAATELGRLGRQLSEQTGTRLLDWIDYLVIDAYDVADEELQQAGFVARQQHERSFWCHPGGLFPRLYVAQPPDLPRGVALKVESVADFLQANRLEPLEPIRGAAGGRWRHAVVFRQDGVVVQVVERHGYPDLDEVEDSADQIASARAVYERFQNRPRNLADPDEGFAVAAELLTQASAEIGVDWACDRFFAAERQYWQDRNPAAQVQRARQDQLGLGWANHDHHTYRAGRRYFAPLIAVLEQLGLQCRERFYAGADAGWGAQVLEQPNCGIVVFADVDLAPDEVTGDFAHQGLPARDQFGTVGLWCQLHGESFLQAGMHHLECQFDFDRAREQLAAAGIRTMAPFTDFPFLKQAFTEGQRWPVEPDRLDQLQRQGILSAPQAEEIRARGALGSHLEILERNDGYKGFNQTGISQIIHQTDPRHHL